MISVVLRKILRFSILITIFTLMISTASERINNNIELSIGYNAATLKTSLAKFSFSPLVIDLTTKLNQKLNFSINYTFGEGDKIIEQNEYDLKWKQWGGSFDYKILNDDKSLWVSLLYREFGIKSTWRNEVDEDSWKGIGLGLSFRPKIRENLYGKIGINYFPFLSGDISNYKNFEVTGQVEYVLKNNKNSLLLHYTNQNLTSLTQNIGDIKVNQLGISFKTKF
ncbi:MAG: hypothetical protein ACK4GJ_03010 [bacterium]